MDLRDGSSGAAGASAAPGSLSAFVDDVWRNSIVAVLTDYIRIPALSPAFDADWDTHGHLARAVALLRSWAQDRNIEGATIEVVELAGRTPLLAVDVPARGVAPGASADDTVLLYGHLDKQPEMSGWREGFGPWTPVRDGERLYGRGGADDGYAMFAALCAIEAVRATGRSHARCVVLIEASEESGSPDLPAHVEALGRRLGNVSLVVCLDSGCADYERLWATTSLRGLVGGVLSVELTTEGLHSGGYGGIVPSSFRVVRQLLDRIEDAATGRVLLPEAWVEIPAERVGQAAEAARILGDTTADLPLVAGAEVRAGRDDHAILLDQTWRPAFEVIGAEGLPAVGSAGNVLRPRTALSLSLRIPPGADASVVQDALARRLTEAPPYGARVRFEPQAAASGWNAPPTAPWLAEASERASSAMFGAGSAAMGEGGTIPFMGMLGVRFPEAQFLVVGALGPGSNAHGPNEFLDLPTARRLTACVAQILADHAVR